MLFRTGIVEQESEFCRSPGYIQFGAVILCRHTDAVTFAHWQGLRRQLLPVRCESDFQVFQIRLGECASRCYGFQIVVHNLSALVGTLYELVGKKVDLLLLRAIDLEADVVHRNVGALCRAGEIQIAVVLDSSVRADDNDSQAPHLLSVVDGSGKVIRIQAYGTRAGASAHRGCRRIGYGN